MSEFLNLSDGVIAAIVRVNVVLAAAIALVLLIRAAARRAFGARLAYALWLIPVLAAAACFIPARVIKIYVDPTDFIANAPVTPSHTEGHADLPPILLMAWAGGFLFYLGILALRQRRFARGLGRLSPRADLGPDVFEAESDRHGPAVIGVLRPIIITPADFERRFSAEERSIVLAHERAHMAQGDPLINAAAALLQCLNWFNPLIHLGLRALRVDQELACDAAVVARAEGARRPYAEAMLKTQIATSDAPLACAWPSATPDSLKERITMLKRTLPSRAQRLLGASAIAAATMGACAAAWSAQPPRVELAVAPTPIADVSVAVTPATAAPALSVMPIAVAEPTMALAPVAASDPNSKIDRVRARMAGAAAPDIDLVEGVAPQIELVGGRTPQARRDADRQRGHDDYRVMREEDLTPEERVRVRREVDRAMAEVRRVQIDPAEQARMRADIARAMREERHVELTQQQQAEIQEHVANAMAHSQEAMERAQIRLRDVHRETALSAEQQARIQEQVERGMERARIGRERAEYMTRGMPNYNLHLRDSEMTPEMRAEMQEISRIAARMGEIASRMRDLTANERAEMDSVRDEMRQHADRLHELTVQERARHPAPRTQHD